MTHLGEIALIINAIATLGACVLAWVNRGKIQQVYLSLNSRLSELLKITAEKSRAEGVEHERERQKNGDPP